jgi:hypothetical protein
MPLTFSGSMAMTTRTWSRTPIPGVGRAEVFPGQHLDVVGGALRGHIYYPSAHLEVAYGLSGSETATATRGSRSTFLTLRKPCTLFMSTCSPSVSTQVWVSCGEPSAIVVAT